MVTRSTSTSSSQSSTTRTEPSVARLLPPNRVPSTYDLARGTVAEVPGAGLADLSQVIYFIGRHLGTRTGSSWRCHRGDRTSHRGVHIDSASAPGASP